MEKSSGAVFYEFPDTTEEINLSDAPFRQKIRDTALLDELRNIISSGKESFSGEYRKRCLPVYSAAIVFMKDKETETIYFSQQCKVLKFQEKELYLDFDKNSVTIESVFKRLRTK